MQGGIVMGKKVGALIKEARTGAGMTQEQLAKKVKGLTASDISKAERGEKELTKEQLKLIAKATGVTQTSLLNAEKGGKTGKTGKTGTSSTAGSSSSSAKNSVKLTAAEKKLVELYREADSDTKKAVMKLLKGDKDQKEEMLNTILGNAMEMLLNAKK